MLEVLLSTNIVRTHFSAKTQKRLREAFTEGDKAGFWKIISEILSQEELSALTRELTALNENYTAEGVVDVIFQQRGRGYFMLQLSGDLNSFVGKQLVIGRKGEQPVFEGLVLNCVLQSDPKTLVRSYQIKCTEGTVNIVLSKQGLVQRVSVSDSSFSWDTRSADAEYATASSHRAATSNERELDGFTGEDAEATILIRERQADNSESNHIKWQRVDELRRHIATHLSETKPQGSEQQEDLLSECLQLLSTTDLRCVDTSRLSTHNRQRFQREFESLFEELLGLYNELDIKFSVETLVAQLVLDANYARVVNKADNLLVLTSVKLLSAAFDEVRKMKQQNLVMFIGNTGAGKSTTVNYLLGHQLRSVRRAEGEHGFEHEDPSGENKAKIGHGLGTSETSYVQAFPLPESPAKMPLVLCDFPGFYDARGGSYDLATHLSIQQAILAAKQVQAVCVVLPYDALTLDRANPIVELLRELQQKLPSAFRTGADHATVNRQIHILITKRPSKISPEDIRQRFTVHLREEQDKLRRLGSSNSDAGQRGEINWRLQLWQSLRAICDDSRVHLIDIGNNRARRALLKSLAQGRGIVASAFTPAANTQVVNKEFGKQVQMSVHTWHKLIFMHYRESIPAAISHQQRVEHDYREGQRSCDAKLVQLRQDIQQKQQENQRLLAEQHKVQAAIDSGQPLESVLPADVLQRLRNSSAAEGALRSLKEQLETAGRDKASSQRKKEQLKSEQSRLQGTTRELKGEVVRAERRISSLSTGTTTKILWEYTQKRPSDIIRVSSFHQGALDSIFGEVRATRDSDFIPGSEKRWYAGDYVGDLISTAYINSEYRLVPEGRELQAAFRRHFRGGQYEATITGQQYSVDRGVNFDPTGRRMVYSFTTHWYGGGKNATMPYIKVQHSQPNSEINAATITNLRSEVSAKQSRVRGNESEIRRLDREITQAENSIRVSEERERDLRQQITVQKQRQQQAAQADEARRLVAERSSSIKINESSISSFYQQISASEAEKHRLGEAAAQACNQQVKLERQKQHLAILIASQWSIAQLLNSFTKIMCAGHAGNVESEAALVQSCKEYTAYFDQHGMEIKLLCQQDIQLLAGKTYSLPESAPVLDLAAVAPEPPAAGVSLDEPTFELAEVDLSGLKLDDPIASHTFLLGMSNRDLRVVKQSVLVMIRSATTQLLLSPAAKGLMDAARQHFKANDSVDMITDARVIDRVKGIRQLSDWLRCLYLVEERLETGRPQEQVLADIIVTANNIGISEGEVKPVVYAAIQLLAASIADTAGAAKAHPRILFFGNTGAGKSTLINYLMGVPLELGRGEAGDDVVRVVTQAEPVSHAEIGQGIGTSHTSAIKRFTTSDGEKETVDLYDLPGLLDNRGEIFNAMTNVAMDQVFRASDLPPPLMIITVPYNAFRVDRAKGVTALVQALRSRLGVDFVKDVLECKDVTRCGIRLAITRIPPAERFTFEQELEGRFSLHLSQARESLVKHGGAGNVSEADFIKEQIAIWTMLKQLYQGGCILLPNLEQPANRHVILRHLATSKGFDVSKLGVSQIAQRDRGKFITAFQQLVGIWVTKVFEPYEQHQENLVKFQREKTRSERVIRQCQEQNTQLNENIKQLRMQRAQYLQSHSMVYALCDRWLRVFSLCCNNISFQANINRQIAQAQSQVVTNTQLISRESQQHANSQRDVERAIRQHQQIELFLRSNMVNAKLIASVANEIAVDAFKLDGLGNTQRVRLVADCKRFGHLYTTSMRDVSLPPPAPRVTGSALLRQYSSYSPFDATTRSSDTRHTSLDQEVHSHPSRICV